MRVGKFVVVVVCSIAIIASNACPGAGAICRHRPTGTGAGAPASAIVARLLLRRRLLLMMMKLLLFIEVKPSRRIDATARPLLLLLLAACILPNDRAPEVSLRAGAAATAANRHGNESRHRACDVGGLFVVDVKPRSDERDDVITHPRARSRHNAAAATAGAATAGAAGAAAVATIVATPAAASVTVVIVAAVSAVVVAGMTPRSAPRGGASRIV